MPTSQQIAIQLSLQNVNTVISGIQAIQSAWLANHRTITKNFLEMQKLHNEEIKLMNETAKAAMKMGDDTSKSGSEAVSVLNKMSGVVGNLAGQFKILGSVIGTVGTGIGYAVGGPGGGAIGGAVGGLIGNIAGAIINIPLAIVKKIGGIIGDVVGKVVDGFKSIGTSINNVIFGPLSLFSLALGKSFQNLSDGINQTISEIWTAAEAFQRLYISIRTLTVRNIASEMGVDILDVTFEQANEEVEKLFTWLKQIALTSPFTMASIADAMKFASAMGLSVGATEALTIATGNFAAAMGLTEDHQYRIMYNLAQIYQQGKLTGREFRDLAISFVPVYDILGEMANEAGMSTEAFKKLALEGGIPVTDFFEHFVNYMNTNYADAMKNMSRTMVGVKNNINDFIQVVMGMEVLGPLMDVISERLASMLDVLLSPKAHAIAKDFGTGLVRAFNAVATALDYVGRIIKYLMEDFGFATPTVESLSKAFVTLYLTAKHAIVFLGSAINVIGMAIKKEILPLIRSLGGVQEESGNWGVNLIKNFAMGMVIGAAKFLAKAIIFIRAIIVGFFKASSPPKITPDIDKYGGGLIDAWIDGMINNAHWNRINKIGDVVRGIFDIQNPDQGATGGGGQGEAGGITGTGDAQVPGSVTNRNAGTYVAPIIDATEDALNDIVYFATEAGMKAAAAFMRGFAEADFTILDEIQGPLKSAIDALVGLGQISETSGLEMFYNFSMDMISAIDEFNKTGEISAKLLEEIGNLGMGLGPELADLVIKEFDLSKAIKEAEEAQKRLNAAIENLGKSRANVRTLIREYNKLLRAGADKSVLKSKLQQINAQESAVVGYRKEKEAAEENKKIADARVEELKQLVSLQTKLVENMIELLDAQASAISKSTSGAGSAMDDLDTTLGKWAEEIANEVWEFDPFDWEAEEGKQETGIAGFFAELTQSFADNLNSGLANIDTSIAAGSFVSNLKNSIRDALGMPFQSDALSISNAILTSEEKSMDATAPGGKSFIQEVIDWISEGNVNLADFIKKLSEYLAAAIEGAANELSLLIANPQSSVYQALFNAGLLLGEAIIKGIWQNIGAAAFPTATTAIQTGEPGAVKKTIEGAINFLAPVVSPVTGLANMIVQGIIDVIKNADYSTIDLNPQGSWYIPDGVDVEGPIKFKPAPANPAEDPLIIQTITGWLGNLRSAFTTVLGATYEGGPASTFEIIGLSAVGGIMGGIGEPIPNLDSPVGSIAKTVDAIIGAFRKKTGADSTDVNTNPFMNIGQAIINGIIAGIEKFKDAIRTAVETLGLEMPAWLKKLLEASSPSKVFARIGKTIPQGLALGIMKSADLVQGALAYAGGGMVGARYIPSTMVAAPATSRVSNVSFGNVYLNNNMDWETFKSRVNRAITER